MSPRYSFKVYINILTCIESIPADNRQCASHCAQGSQRSRRAENTHRELDLQEDDGGSLPADSAEVDAILRQLEDLMSLSVVLQICTRRRMFDWEVVFGGGYLIFLNAHPC